ncbi:MAG: hypothetical protein HC811_11035 [Flammeovirgaceae bacterium]|nr:hypothetical protein [Flammeovirgaceae bacterium]
MILRKTIRFILCVVAVNIVFGCQSPQPHGVISSASPEATDVGVKILERGGNAIDAAVAISFALGVTEPAMSGLGGGTQLLVSIPGTAPFLINGTTYAPALTDSLIAKDSLTFHKRTTIPSTVKVLEYAWKKYGSGNISWEKLLEPAIDLAKNGFEVGRFRAAVYKQYEKSMTSSPYSTQLWLKDNSTIPAIGDRIVQPVLAKTMERLAVHGGTDFYSGEIAKTISMDMEKNGGWIRLNDLKNFPEPTELPALHVQYKDHDVYSMPPPGGGYAVLQILKVYNQQQNSDLRDFEKWARALKMVHNDRDANPIKDLVKYEMEIDERLTEEYINALINAPELPDDSLDSSGETTHFSVVDKNGLAVAVTASINAYFGAKAASPELGFFYNSYMDDFEFGKPDHPDAIRAGSMAFSSMSPTIVRKEGRTVLIVGSPGSKRIISTVAQVSANWIIKNDVTQAVNKKRFHVSGRNFYVEDLDLADSLLIVGVPGMRVRKANDTYLHDGVNAYFGGVHAIAWQNGQWVGAADPRRDGKVGYSK